MTKKEEKRVQEILVKAAADLTEAGCEAVQILSSWHSANGTDRMNYGLGNWFARKGMAQEFVEDDQARINANQIGKTLKRDNNE